MNQNVPVIIREERPPYDPSGKKLAKRTGTTVSKPKLSKRLRYTSMYLQALDARKPWRQVSMVLWILFAGWVLFLAVAIAGLMLMLTIVLIPFGVQTLRFAVFVFNPIGKEPYVPDMPLQAQRFKLWFKKSLSNPGSPITILVNVLWLFLFGWELFLGCLFLAFIQFLTIIGFNNSLRLIRVGIFLLWPFGRQIRYQQLPPWPAPPVNVPMSGAQPIIPSTTTLPIGFERSNLV